MLRAQLRAGPLREREGGDRGRESETMRERKRETEREKQREREKTYIKENVKEQILFRKICVGTRSKTGMKGGQSK